MKAILLLTLFLFFNISLCGDEKNVSTIFQGTWYSTGATKPEKIEEADCCVPLGEIKFDIDEKDKEMLVMSATHWGGRFCGKGKIEPEIQMKVPFAKFNFLGEVAIAQGLENDQHIGFNIWNINMSHTFPNNGSQIMQLDLYLNYEHYEKSLGMNCSVTISKSGSILTVLSVSFIALFSLLFL